jgi:hypothetical protein
MPELAIDFPTNNDADVNWEARVIINHDSAVHSCHNSSDPEWTVGAANFKMYHPTDPTQPDLLWQNVTPDPIQTMV